MVRGIVVLLILFSKTVFAIENTEVKHPCEGVGIIFPLKEKDQPVIDLTPDLKHCTTKRDQERICRCVNKNNKKIEAYRATADDNIKSTIPKIDKDFYKPYQDYLTDKARIALLSLAEQTSELTRNYKEAKLEVPDMAKEAKNCVFSNKMGKTAKDPIYSCSNTDSILSEEERKNRVNELFSKFSHQYSNGDKPKDPLISKKELPSTSSCNNAHEITDDFIAFTKQKMTNTHLVEVFEIIENQFKANPELNLEEEVSKYKLDKKKKSNLNDFFNYIPYNEKANKNIIYYIENLTNELKTSPTFKNMSEDPEFFKKIVKDIKEGKHKEPTYFNNIYKDYITKNKKKNLENLNKQCKDITDNLNKILCASDKSEFLPKNLKDKKVLLHTGEIKSVSKEDLKYYNNLYLNDTLCSDNKKEKKPLYDEVTAILNPYLTDDLKEQDRFKNAVTGNYIKQVDNYRAKICHVFPTKDGKVPSLKSLEETKAKVCPKDTEQKSEDGNQQEVCMDYIDRVVKVLYGENSDGKGGLFGATAKANEEEIFNKYMKANTPNKQDIITEAEAREKAKNEVKSLKFDTTTLMDTFKSWQQGEHKKTDLENQLFLGASKKKVAKSPTKIPESVRNDLNNSVGTPTGQRRSSSSGQTADVKFNPSKLKGGNVSPSSGASSRGLISQANANSSFVPKTNNTGYSSSGIISRGSPNNTSQNSPNINSDNSTSKRNQENRKPITHTYKTKADKTSQPTDRNPTSQQPGTYNQNSNVDTNYEDLSDKEKQELSYNKALEDAYEAKKNGLTPTTAAAVKVVDNAGGSGAKGIGLSLPSSGAGSSQNGPNNFDAALDGIIASAQLGISEDTYNSLKEFITSDQKEFLIIHPKDEHKVILEKKKKAPNLEIKVKLHESSNQADPAFNHFFETIQKSRHVKNGFKDFINAFEKDSMYTEMSSLFQSKYEED